MRDIITFGFGLLVSLFLLIATLVVFGLLVSSLVRLD